MEHPNSPSPVWEAFMKHNPWTDPPVDSSPIEEPVYDPDCWKFCLAPFAGSVIKAIESSESLDLDLMVPVASQPVQRPAGQQTISPAALMYQVQLRQLADWFIQMYGLRRPCDKPCAYFVIEEWKDRHIWRRLRQAMIVRKLMSQPFEPLPATSQGPRDPLFLDYIAAAVAQEQLEPDDEIILLYRMFLDMYDISRHQELEIMKQPKILLTMGVLHVTSKRDLDEDEQTMVASSNASPSISPGSKSKLGWLVDY